MIAARSCGEVHFRQELKISLAWFRYSLGMAVRQQRVSVGRFAEGEATAKRRFGKSYRHCSGHE
jgi:hypothetical protein